eukprot:TRINITY_DN107344_c0_g1_i1.p1 TRINITY_DN107344_c0_g1~~TRINITY_DN107344_c0_g1_i1.p1  ORF type:complete len:569 (+),score=57.55 TRINITY_DN107344_c0_g1_i1:85-1791(+)
MDLDTLGSSSSTLKAGKGTFIGNVLREWKNYVFSEAYMRSGISRRSAWWWLVPLCGVGQALGAITISRQVPDAWWGCWYVQVVVFCTYLLMGRMATTTIYPDMIGISISVVYFWDITHSMDSEYTNLVASQCMTILVVTGTMGSHSTCLALLSVALSWIVVSDPRTTSDQKASIPFVMAWVTAGFAVFEYCLASLWTELQLQLKISQLLLDKASDGFCSVDQESGIISYASHGIRATFNCDCVGLELARFVQSACQDKVQAMITAKGDMQRSALVTLYKMDKMAPSQEIDAIICPFHSMDGHVFFFIRVQGESRDHAPEVESQPLPGRLSPLPEDIVPHTSEAKPDVDAGLDHGSELSFSYSDSTLTNKSLYMRRRGCETGTQTEPFSLPASSWSADRPPTYPTKRPQRTSGTSQSVSSHVSAAAYQASLSCTALRETSLTIRIQGTLRLLRQWNIQLSSSVCCPLHAHIQECRKVLKKLNRMRCEDRDKFALAMGDEQCDRCGSVNFYPLDDDATGCCMWCASCEDEDFRQLQSDEAQRQVRGSCSRSSSLSSSQSSQEAQSHFVSS